MNAIKQGNRIQWIDAVKGFAILLVIIGHCLDGYLKANTFPHMYKQYYGLWYFIYSFHMPLFFWISGITFWKAYITPHPRELRKKSYSLQLLNTILLYVIWALILWGAKMVFAQYTNTEYSVTDLFLMFVEPLGNYWYIYVLAILYIISVVVHLYKTDMRVLVPALFICCVVVGCWLKHTNDFTGRYTIYRVIYNLFFFVIGMAVAQKESLLNSRWILAVAAAFATLMWGLRISIDMEIFESPILRPLLALSMSYLVLYVARNIKWISNNCGLTFCGRYCLHIYLIHPYITAGNRTILPELGINNPWVSLCVNFIIALVVPLIIAVIASKNRILNLFFKPCNLVRRYFGGRRR